MDRGGELHSMSTFVFMVPIIAFFGTGKQATVVTAMIFGGMPVVRLTVVELCGLPESMREATMSFGTKVVYSQKS